MGRCRGPCAAALGDGYPPRHASRVGGARTDGNGDRIVRSESRPTLYDILQVSPTAETEIIEAAYRRLARKYHPDVNHRATSGRRMTEINAAYEVLRDPQRRTAYDAELRRSAAYGP